MTNAGQPAPAGEDGSSNQRITCWGEPSRTSTATRVPTALSCGRRLYDLASANPRRVVEHSGALEPDRERGRCDGDGCRSGKPRADRGRSHVDSCALVPERERDQSADRVCGAGRQCDATFLDSPDHFLTFNGRVRNIPDELRAVIPGSFRLPIEIDLLWRSVADGHGQPLSDRGPLHPRIPRPHLQGTMSGRRTDARIGARAWVFRPFFAVAY